MVVGCVGTGYVLRVELPVQRRLCPIFVRDVRSPDIHECFRELTGSQRTPGIWGVTCTYMLESITTCIYTSSTVQNIAFTILLQNHSKNKILHKVDS